MTHHIKKALMHFREWLLRELVEDVIQHELVLAQDVIGFRVVFDSMKDVEVEADRVSIRWEMHPSFRPRLRELARVYASGGRLPLPPARDVFGFQVEMQDEHRLDRLLSELDAWEERALLNDALQELDEVIHAVRRIVHMLGYRKVEVKPVFPGIFLPPPESGRGEGSFSLVLHRPRA